MITFRFHFVLCALAILAVSSRAADTFNRPDMMKDMAHNCIQRGVSELSARADALVLAAQYLKAAPNRDTLRRAQIAWSDLQLTHKRYEMLSRGPVKDAAFWAAIFSFTPSPTAIENFAHGDQPIDENQIELLGSTARGFYAMEYLLFELTPQSAGKVGSEERGNVSPSGSLLLQGEAAGRRRLYILELSRDLSRRLHEASQTAQATDFASHFAEGKQDSANLLVSQIVTAIESNLSVPLKTYLDRLNAGTLRYDQIEGVPSGTALSGMKAALEGVRDYYRGADGLGIDDYARSVNPGLDERIEAQFKTTAAALDALNDSLEKSLATQRPAVEKALEESRKLELLCKVDLASTLGITVMFSAMDGD